MIKKDDSSFTHEEWCEFLSTIESKDDQQQYAAQIKRLAASKAEVANYGRYLSENVTHKKKARTGVLLSRQQYNKKKSNYKGYQ